MGTPIVFEWANRGGKRKKSKPRSTEADRAQRFMYRASRRTVDAAATGLQSYDKARRLSQRRDRDGAVVELLPNMARGMSAGASRLAPVPLDLMRATWSKSTRETVRRSLRVAARATDRRS